MIEAKTEIVTLRLTPSQVERFRSCAAGEGMRLTTWIRQVVATHARSQGCGQAVPSLPSSQ